MSSQPKPLSLRLREGTRKAHRIVENLGFVRCFLRGAVSLEAYGHYLVDLEHVYGELERGLRLHAAHPVLQPLIVPALWRQAALREDIHALARRQPLPRTASEPARAYGERLRALAEEQPELLVAHAYTRYLGDLSGGQILGRIVARTLGLSDEDGLRFYAFPELADRAAFKCEYRARLDSLPVDEQLAQRIVDEAITAFELNGAVLQAQSGSALRSVWRLVMPTAVARLRPA